MYVVRVVTTNRSFMPDQIIPITRPNVSQSVPSPQKVESKFPTEVINLPSKGWFYSRENPLSSGQLELKMMTAKEEDILTSPNLIQKQIVLDKLLEAVVIDKSINLNDMLVCDRNAAFFAIRRLAYGDQYDATVTCPRCGKENSISIDLGKLDNRPFDFDKYPKEENAFQFKLPYSGKVVTFKLLTKKDEDAIEAELKGMEKISKDLRREVTTRLGHIIIAIDGSDKQVDIRRFVNEELVSKDSLALRTHMRGTLPDIDTTFDFVCNSCQFERKEETPMGASFFWPQQ
jgi:hypothetical protein